MAALASMAPPGLAEVSLGGTTRVAEAAPKGAIAREMTVRFDANVDGAVPWQVTAAKPITGKIGTAETVVFTALNISNKTITAQAAYNVTPELTGQYFNKIQCFCFTEQDAQARRDCRDAGDILRRSRYRPG